MANQAQPSEVSPSKLMLPGEPGATYTATWDCDGKVIYRNEPAGNLFGRLPLGAWPVSFADDADPWKEAHFALPKRSTRTLTVRRDPLTRYSDDRCVNCGGYYNNGADNDCTCKGDYRPIGWPA